MSNLPPTYLAGWHNDDKVAKLTYRRLGNTDLIVSPIGIGGSVIGGVYLDKVVGENVNQCLEEAVRSGLNYIDTSPFYGEGKSEELMGKALTRIPRHTYYIG